MFQTSFVRAFHERIRANLRAALEQLNACQFNGCLVHLAELKADVEQGRDQLSSADEGELNELYLLGAYVTLLDRYATYWRDVHDGDFTSSWDALQDCLDTLRLIRKFIEYDSGSLLGLLESRLPDLEKIYPYKVFFSIAATVDLYECSICGKDIDSVDCDHIRGDLYGGILAIGIAREITNLDHVSAVMHPKDKRCVVKFENDARQFHLVRYLSGLLIDGRLHPLELGPLRFKSKRIRNPEFRKVGGNAPCYCGSGVKFKRCCSSKEFVQGEHVDFVADQAACETFLTTV